LVAVGAVLGALGMFGARASDDGPKGRSEAPAKPKDNALVAIVCVERRWNLWAAASVSATTRVSAWGAPARTNLVVYRSRGPNVVLLDPEFASKGGRVSVLWLDGSAEAARVVSIVYPTSGRDNFIASNQEVFAALVLPEGVDIGTLAKGDTLRIVF
jgi:prepilin-type processing-associated H-X9-DG protein